MFRKKGDPSALSSEYSCVFKVTWSAPLQSEEPGSRLWERQDPRVPTSPAAPHTAWVPGLQGVLSREAPQLGAHRPLGAQASVVGGWLPAWVLSDNEARLGLGPSGAFIFS